MSHVGGTDVRMPTDASLNHRLLALLLEAHTEHQDFAGWLVGRLASLAAVLGSSEEVVAGRPGSWEAAHMRDLLASAVGSDDGELHRYRADEYVAGPDDGPDRAMHQGRYWRDADGVRVEIVDIPRAYLENVVGHLRRWAGRLHAHERVAATTAVTIAQIDEGDVGDALAYAAWVANRHPAEWVEGTTLMGALLARIRLLAGESPAGRHTHVQCGEVMYIVDIGLERMTWRCPRCGVLVAHDRPGEAVDVDQWTAPTVPDAL